MSLPIDGINALYNTNKTDSSESLEKTLGSDLSQATDDELMEVCKDFESYFTEQMFKAMQKMVPDSNSEVSASTKQLQDYYKDEMVKNFADDSAQGSGLGLAQTLYEQMKRNYNL